jgi:Lrp/AsnC family leucine-responsive transcriptional regulator
MLTTPLDNLDRRILETLQEDGKITNTKLAETVHLSPSPCLARVKRMEDSGFIQRYVALVDPKMVGLSLNVFVHVSLERQIKTELGRFESMIQIYPEVMECYLMSGDADYLIRVVVPDIEALERFILDKLSTIPGLAQIRSSFAMKQVKFKTSLPLPETYST